MTEEQKQSVPEAEVVNETPAQPESIEVPMELAVQMKMVEFDKAIADAELQVSGLKKQKMDFIYDQNLQMIKTKYKKAE